MNTPVMTVSHWHSYHLSPAPQVLESTSIIHDVSDNEHTLLWHAISDNTNGLKYYYHSVSSPPALCLASPSPAVGRRGRAMFGESGLQRRAVLRVPR